ncbi:Polysaccharide pyruvyl transferase [Sphingobium yanoikuyae]|uniref:Polysaccharide pyruvyl transferase n=1 Tax=Sphingobium yanoikuyae TaxID=13690 RepID=A0A084EBF9_SPHYA|nr:polysaccharide pyruvyl transferase family protein [Sphingobium yanoikuyae]KEZ15301.1 Polysaccharide pyruvyl transferase [Sphingobium yanoikuyae]
MSNTTGLAAAGGYSSDTGRTITIGLLWHSLNSGNLGVGALTLANIAIVREVATKMGLRLRFVIMAPRDQGTPALPIEDAEVFVIDRRSTISSRDFWRAVGGVDCVLDIGAGDSFADIYGPKRFAFLWLTKMMTIMRHVPLVLSPQTIGPFTKPAYKAPAAWAMSKSRVVFARDEASRAVASAMAPDANVQLSVDVAFVLPFEDRSHERGSSMLRVGVNVSGLLLHEAESGRNRFGLSYDYAAFTRGLLTTLSARDDVEIHLVPHATSNRDAADDDGCAADRLAAEFPAAIRVPNFVGPSEAKSYISSLDFLVAGRMHACIGAFSAGTPVIPIAYSRKFSGLFGLLGYDKIVPVQGNDDADVQALVMQGLANRHALAQDMRAGMARVTALLDVYRVELQSLLGDIMGRRA